MRRTRTRSVPRPTRIDPPWSRELALVAGFLALLPAGLVGASSTLHASAPAPAAAAPFAAPAPRAAVPPLWFNQTKAIGAGPSGPFGGAAFDPQLGSSGGDIVYFGGCASLCPSNATWIYDGNSWAQWLSGPFPPARELSLLDYDPALGGVLLYGGTNSTGPGGTLSPETWLFNGTGWSNLTATSWGANPPPGLLGAMAWDPALHGMLLVGGCPNTTCASYSSRAYLLNSTGWHNILAAPPGLDLVAASMAWDPTAAAMVLFGGNNSVTGRESNATWLLQGSAWHNRTGTAGCASCVYPSAREFALMTWDGETNRIVLFGGVNSTTGRNSNQTWEFDGGTGWSLLAPPSGGPVPAQIFGAMPVNSSITAPILLPGLSGSCGTCLHGATWVLDRGPSISRPTIIPNSPVVGVPTLANATNVSSAAGSGPWLLCNVGFGDGSFTVSVLRLLSRASGWNCSGNDTYTVPGPYTISVSVRDFFGVTAAAAVPVSVGGMISANVTFAPATPEARAPIQFTASVTNGTPPLTSSWSFGDGGTGSGLAVSHTYATQGTYTVRFNLTDGYGAHVTWVQILVVLPHLSANATASALRTDAGNRITFAGSAAGGSGTYSSYLWQFGDGSQASGSGASYAYAFPGQYTVSLRVTDSLGFTSLATVVVHVASPISVQLSVSPAPSVVGQPVQFRANASGGTSPLAYRWFFGDGQTSTDGAPQHAYGSNGGYTVLLWVNDSVGGSVERSFALAVYPNSTSPTAPLFWANPYFWGALVVVAGAAVAGVVLLRRRGAPPARELPEPEDQPR